MTSIIVGIILAALFGFVSFFVTNNIFIGVGIFLITILYFALLIRKRFKKYKNNVERFHECYRFVSNFIVTLSIKGSISSSLESCINLGSEQLKEEVKNISDFNDIEKVNYLSRYFHFNVYRMFTDILAMWADQGGDILKMTRYISSQMKDIEEYLIFIESTNKRQVIEFGVMWFLSISILFALKITLKDLFPYIEKQVLFPICVCLFFVLILVSIELITRRMVKIKLRGWINEK